jgi:hypothetical protein
MSFALMYQHQFEIETVPGVDPDPGTFSPIAKGITAVEPNNNEETSQDKYLDGQGMSETDVIGGQLTLAFTGHRNYEDAAQNFVYEKSQSFGNSRRTNFRWTQPDGSMFEGSATIANISGPSGDAGAKGEISFEIHFNGLPTYTPST